MNSNQNDALKQKRQWLIRDFWFLTAVIVLNFLLFAIKELFKSIKVSDLDTIIGAFWFPIFFGLMSGYAIIRFYNFLEKKLNFVSALIICCFLTILTISVALILLISIIGTGHGGPLDFFYEEHFISLIVVTLVMIIPYVIIIISIIYVSFAKANPV